MIDSLGNRHLQPRQVMVLRAMMLVLSYCDSDLFGHSAHVAHEARRLAPPGQGEAWYWAGLLHDIGMITLDRDVLHKCGGLTGKERKVMQLHTLRGATILQVIRAPDAVVDGARFHHGRWDGKGYPYPIRGRHIPLIARVLAVAAVYTALMSDRPYRRALTPAQARLEIERSAGSQFDPEVVAQFFQEKPNGESAQ